MRSSLTKTLQGDVSAIFKALMMDVFFSDVHNFHSSGISLQLPNGEHLQVYMRLEIVIADEAALHSIYTCKGASGLKCCLLCQNIFTDDSVVAPDGWAQLHTCSDTSQLVLHTTGSTVAVINRLQVAAADVAAGHLTKDSFNELKTRLGYNYVEGSVMLDARCRAIVDPTSHAVHDWMHVFFVNGIFNVHMGRLMQETSCDGISYKVVHEYLEQWRHPKALESKIKATTGGATSAKRARSSWEAGVLKATASESLSMLPILAHFFQTMAETSPSANLRHHAACLTELADVVELIRKSSRAVIDPVVLRARTESYLSSFKHLYGADSMPPKFHSSLHFSFWLTKWRHVPNCFVLERKHKQAKKFANEVRNTSGAWEGGISREVTSRRLAVLADHQMPDEIATLLPPLAQPTAAVKEVLDSWFNIGGGRCTDVCREIFTAKLAKVNEWEKISVGDVVMMRSGEIGEVLFLAF